MLHFVLVWSHYLLLLAKLIFCRKAEGYPSGNYTLENKLLASKYIEADNHWQLLANCTEVQLFTYTFLFTILSYNFVLSCTKG